jgi:hypothetical protein
MSILNGVFKSDFQSKITDGTDPSPTKKRVNLACLFIEIKKILIGDSL